jgi:hypothetical protein
LLVGATPTDVIVMLRELRVGNMRRRRQARILRRDDVLTDPAADLTVWFRTADFFRVAERWSGNEILRTLAAREPLEFAAANIYLRDDGVLVRYAARVAGARPTLAAVGKALDVFPMGRPPPELFLQNLPPWAHRVHAPAKDGGAFAKPVSERALGPGGEHVYANVDCGGILHGWRPDENSLFGSLALLRPQLLLDVYSDGSTVVASGMMPLPLGLPVVRCAGQVNWLLFCALLQAYLFVRLGVGLGLLAFVARPDRR